MIPGPKMSDNALQGVLNYITGKYEPDSMQFRAVDTSLKNNPTTCANLLEHVHEKLVDADNKAKEAGTSIDYKTIEREQIIFSFMLQSIATFLKEYEMNNEAINQNTLGAALYKNLLVHQELFNEVYWSAIHASSAGEQAAQNGNIISTFLFAKAREDLPLTRENLQRRKENLQLKANIERETIGTVSPKTLDLQKEEEKNAAEIMSAPPPQAPEPRIESINREQAISALTNPQAPAGTYLIRISSQAGQYAMSYVDKNNTIQHIAFDKNELIAFIDKYKANGIITVPHMPPKASSPEPVERAKQVDLPFSIAIEKFNEYDRSFGAGSMSDIKQRASEVKLVIDSIKRIRDSALPNHEKLQELMRYLGNIKNSDVIQHPQVKNMAETVLNKDLGSFHRPEPIVPMRVHQNQSLNNLISKGTVVRFDNRPGGIYIEFKNEEERNHVNDMLNQQFGPGSSRIAGKANMLEVLNPNVKKFIAEKPATEQQANPKPPLSGKMSP